MPTVWYSGVVTKIKSLTTTIKQFTVRVDTNSLFEFVPGQFVTMDLPVGEKRLDRWKSYSIANSPNNSNELEFCIAKTPLGLGTNYLFNDVVEGTILKFKGPDGSFILPISLQKELIFICTGTGIAPFRSMLMHIYNQNQTFNKIHLIVGTRKLQDVLYEEECIEMKNKFSNFEYSIALSRENLSPYHHGYVHAIYKQLYVEPDSNRQFYICGWSNMIDESVANLTSMGYDKSQIHFELYG